MSRWLVAELIFSVYLGIWLVSALSRLDASHFNGIGIFLAVAVLVCHFMK